MSFIHTIVLIGCLQLDIVMVSDFSGSVVGHDHFIKKALSTFVNRFDLYEDGVMISVIRFSTKTVVISPLTDNRDSLLARINRIPNAKVYGNTQMLLALNRARMELASNGREGVSKMIILISDGDPNDPKDVMQFATHLKDVRDITICGILINGSQAQDKYMRNISSPPCYVATNFESLADQLEVLDICM